MLDYAAAMTRTPADVPEPLLRELEKALPKDHLVELTAAIAQENFRARFNRPFGIESMDVSEGAVCPLPER